MKSLTRRFLAGAALALPLIVSAKVERSVTKEFVVQPGGHLAVETEGGDISIKTGDADKVHVVAVETIRASSDKEADELLANLKLTLEQNGNDVTAAAKYTRDHFGFHFGGSPVQVSFEVTVPRNFNLDLRTSGGDVTVASLTGNVHARTSGGELRFDRIDGEIDASTSGGNVELKEGTARAKLTTSGGNVRVDRAAGPIEVSTSGGDIALDSVADLVSASTSGGNVRANLTGPMKRDAVLSTSGGDVKVRLAKAAAFRLDASTSGGDVNAPGLTLTIESGSPGKDHLVAAVNGGGPTLKLRSSGGDITVEAN